MCLEEIELRDQNMLIILGSNVNVIERNNHLMSTWIRYAYELQKNEANGYGYDLDS